MYPLVLLRRHCSAPTKPSRSAHSTSWCSVSVPYEETVGYGQCLICVACGRTVALKGAVTVSIRQMSSLQPCGSKMGLLLDRLGSEPIDLEEDAVSKSSRSEKTRGLCDTSNKSINVQMTGNPTQVLGPVMNLHMAATCFPLIKVQPRDGPQLAPETCAKLTQERSPGTDLAS